MEELEPEAKRQRVSPKRPNSIVTWNCNGTLQVVNNDSVLTNVLGSLNVYIHVVVVIPRIHFSLHVECTGDEAIVDRYQVS